MTAPVIAATSVEPDSEPTPTVPELPRTPRRPGRLRGRAWGLYLAFAVVAVAVLWAVIPGVFAPGDPLTGVPADKLLPPSAAHWFGTDTLGRDLFGRVVHGAVHSLSGALIAVTVGLALGTVLGAIAGAVGGVVDDVLMRIVDVLLAIPGLLLSLSVIILLGFGTVNAALAVGLGSVAAFARLMRAEVARVRRTEYVEAAFGSGATFLAVLRRHVLPNSLTPSSRSPPCSSGRRSSPSRRSGSSATALRHPPRNGDC